MGDTFFAFTTWSRKKKNDGNENDEANTFHENQIDRTKTFYRKNRYDSYSFNMNMDQLAVSYLLPRDQISFGPPVTTLCKHFTKVYHYH